MKGSYILLIELYKAKTIRYGKSYHFDFPKGWYVYVGSAMNSIESRVQRHFSQQKNFHWHIDYLLFHSTIKKAYYKENNVREECDIANLFASRFNYVPFFGSSDCHCPSHLFYGNKKRLQETINDVGMKLFKQK